MRRGRLGLIAALVLLSAGCRAGAPDEARRGSSPKARSAAKDAEEPRPDGPLADFAGRTYDEGRRSLIARGFVPVPRSSAAYCGTVPQCEAFQEAEACSGSGLARCKFVFSRGREAAVVTTAGESADGDSPGSVLIESVEISPNEKR
jgi:hypothetical protein